MPSVRRHERWGHSAIHSNLQDRNPIEDTLGRPILGGWSEQEARGNVQRVVGMTGGWNTVLLQGPGFGGFSEFIAI
jgi:hypothetical protein